MNWPRLQVVVRIRVGSRFRLTYRETSGGGTSAEILDFLDLTRGEHETAINPNRGIWPYPAVGGPSGEEERIPAIVCRS